MSERRFGAMLARLDARAAELHRNNVRRAFWVGWACGFVPGFLLRWLA